MMFSTLPKGVFIKDGTEVKECKQCHRTLSVKRFRRNVPRGDGKYNTIVGYHTICIECKAVENLASRLYKKQRSALDHGTELDEATKQSINDVTNHYRKLKERGYVLVTKYANLLVDPAYEKHKVKTKRVLLNFIDR